MNKAESIANWTRIQNAAAELKLVAEQQMNTAARLESEAKSALNELGASPGRRRKVKKELPPEQRTSLLAGLTKPGKRRIMNT